VTAANCADGIDWAYFTMLALVHDVHCGNVFLILNGENDDGLVVVVSFMGNLSDT